MWFLMVSVSETQGTMQHGIPNWTIYSYGDSSVVKRLKDFQITVNSCFSRNYEDHAVTKAERISLLIKSPKICSHLVPFTSFGAWMLTDSGTLNPK